MKYIVDDNSNDEHLGIPCVHHKDDIVTCSIKFYLNMHMRKFTRQLNTNSQRQKKLSEFCKTWFTFIILTDIILFLICNLIINNL